MSIKWVVDPRNLIKNAISTNLNIFTTFQYYSRINELLIPSEYANVLTH